MNVFRRMVLIPEDEYSRLKSQHTPDEYDPIANVIYSDAPNQRKVQLYNQEIEKYLGKRREIVSPFVHQFQRIINSDLPEPLKFEMMKEKVEQISRNTGTTVDSINIDATNMTPLHQQMDTSIRELTDNVRKELKYPSDDQNFSTPHENFDNVLAFNAPRVSPINEPSTSQGVRPRLSRMDLPLASQAEKKLKKPREFSPTRVLSPQSNEIFNLIRGKVRIDRSGKLYKNNEPDEETNIEDILSQLTSAKQVSGAPLPGSEQVLNVLAKKKTTPNVIRNKIALNYINQERARLDKLKKLKQKGKGLKWESMIRF